MFFIFVILDLPWQLTLFSVKKKLLLHIFESSIKNFFHDDAVILWDFTHSSNIILNQKTSALGPMVAKTLVVWKSVLRTFFSYFVQCPGLATLCSLRVGKSFLDKNDATSSSNTESKVNFLFLLFNPKINIGEQNNPTCLSQVANLTLKVTLHTRSGAAAHRWVRPIKNHLQMNVAPWCYKDRQNKSNRMTLEYANNIARCTTDPEIDSVTWIKFSNNMAPLALVAYLTTRWRHLD